MLKAAHAYLSTQINTTSQGEILLLLYDGAIKFLSQAKERMQAKDYAQKGILISRALDVIAELDGSLNAEKGGDVAQNLHKLYFYCNTRLLRANLEMNEGHVDEVIKIMEAMRNAFKEISQAEGMVAEGQAKSIAQAADKARAPLADGPQDHIGATPRPQTGQAYGPGPRMAVPEPPDSEPEPTEDVPVQAGHEDADVAGPEQMQDAPARPANLRMVAKLKAYHRAGN